MIGATALARCMAQARRAAQAGAVDAAPLQVVPGGALEALIFGADPAEGLAFARPPSASPASSAPSPAGAWRSAR